MKRIRRVKNQFPALLKRNTRLFFGFKGAEMIRLIFLFGGPIIIAWSLSWIMGGHFSTQLSMNVCALLIMVMAAIYIGTFNSLLTICNEKQILKYEFISGVSPAAYVLSIAVVQLGVCFVQAALFSFVYMTKLELPSVDFLLGKNMTWFISFFLILYSSDMLGLLLSSISSNGETANFISPICLIAQILFSGTLWSMDSFFSRCMIARWGMASLGSLINIGTIDVGLAQALSTEEMAVVETGLNTVGYNWESANSMISEYLITSSGIDVSIYQQTGSYVLSTWGYMLMIIIALLFINILIIRSVKSRRR